MKKFQIYLPLQDSAIKIIKKIAKRWNISSIPEKAFQKKTTSSVVMGDSDISENALAASLQQTVLLLHTIA